MPKVNKCLSERQLFRRARTYREIAKQISTQECIGLFGSQKSGGNGQSHGISESSQVIEAHYSPQPSINYDESESSQESTDSECEAPCGASKFSQFHELSFQQKLVAWGAECNVPHSSLRSLLGILKSHSCHAMLPKDPRTLLQTPRSVNLRGVHPGQYCHIGLEYALRKVCESFDNYPAELKLMVGIDGLPISKSSGSQLWPILCNFIVEGKVLGPYVIGCYHGLEKPKSPVSFLRDFVEEVRGLTLSGLEINERVIAIRLHAIICDAPAKSFVTGTKGHSGYYGCPKCTQEGEYIQGRICYPSIEYTERTDESFANKEQEDHHIGPCPLDVIPNFGIVTQMPFDYMHLICLGVVRKLLNLWIKAKIPIRLDSKAICKISDLLCTLKPFIPTEFVRRPRRLQELDRWKATELRQFLLYTGPLVLRTELSSSKFKHFMTLHVAVSILVSLQSCLVYNEYAKSLLKHFVQTFLILYGPQYVSYNVHGLLHIADDVKVYGALDSFSAFGFENFMQSLKKMLRKSERPLQQIVKRSQEMSHFKATEIVPAKPIFEKQHENGPLTKECQNPQYKKVILHSFILDSERESDNCCGLEDGTVIVVKNIAFDDMKECVVVGYKFLRKNNYYTIPCQSSLLGTYFCSGFSQLEHWPVKVIQKKFVKFPFKDGFVVFNMLHT